MRLLRNIILSLEILAAHRVRTLLSLTGIIIGVATVLIIASAGKGAEKSILDRIHAMGTNIVIINAGQTQIFSGRQRQLTIVTTLSQQDAAAIEKECPSVTHAAPAVSRKMQIDHERDIVNTTVMGITGNGFEIKNVSIAQGRFYTPEEEKALRRVAVLGPTVARYLSPDGNVIGMQIRIGKVLFEVIGVTVAKGTDINGGDQDDIIYIPLGTAMRRVLNIDYVHTIFAQADSPASLGQAEREITDLLRQRHRLRGNPDDFNVQNQARLLDTERATTQSMSFLIGGVAAISLLVGGFGIMAVMIMSVRERKKEIGLRRALGASHLDIRNQFIIESCMLATSGGLLGIILGLAVAQGVSFIGYWDTIISWPVAVIAFVFSITIGLVFGVYPALRASRMEPIQALRAE